MVENSLKVKKLPPSSVPRHCGCPGASVQILGVPFFLGAYTVRSAPQLRRRRRNCDARRRNYDTRSGVAITTPGRRRNYDGVAITAPTEVFIMNLMVYLKFEQLFNSSHFFSY